MSRERVELDPLIEGYLSYMAEVRRSAKGTVRDMRCTLRGVSEWMAAHQPGKALWKLDLRAYLEWLEAMREAGRTPGHLAKNLSHLRGLLEYAWRSGRTDRNVLDGFSLPNTGRRVPPEVLTVEEAKHLLAACGSATAQERAERTMLLLLYGCGLRTGELCGLDVTDVNRERRELFVTGKGSRERHVPIPLGVWSEVATYLLDRDGKRGPLFRTLAKRCRVDLKLVSEVVQRAAARAGLSKRVTPKTLRHSYATHLMSAGVDLAVISELMGHRSPSETGVYLHAFANERREAVEVLQEEAM
ncbi:MAG: tyrosine-type recombinase/integrase [Planctomycetes bacterium]|nr:tyrosine-type recombinase/integrase [Planctomycetota bacterium]